MINYFIFIFRRTKSLPRSQGGQRRGSWGSFSDLAGLELFSSYQRPQGQQEEVRLRRRPTPETCLENSELYLNAGEGAVRQERLRIWIEKGTSIFILMWFFKTTLVKSSHEKFKVFKPILKMGFLKIHQQMFCFLNFRTIVDSFYFTN